jgi:hypothetical protein
MISKSFTIIAVLTLLSAAAHAGSAPKELYGKSITVQWSEAHSERYQSEQVTREIGVARQMSIYISTAGRPFVRVLQTGIAGYSRQQNGGVAVARGSTSDVAPGESPSAAKDRVDFEGRSIDNYRVARAELPSTSMAAAQAAKRLSSMAEKAART